MGNIIGVVVILVGAYFIIVGVRGTQGAVFSGLTTGGTKKQATTDTTSSKGQGGTGMRAYMAHSGVRYG